jgi:parallel beta-helix repeat protein
MRTRIRVLVMVLPLLLMALAGSAWTAEWVVYSMYDSGEGSLRQCMEEAGNGDTVTFSPMIFPPADPGYIVVVSPLPSIACGNVTIEASNAGVVLNGSATPGGTAGLIVASDSNSIRGVEIINFPAGGVILAAGADHNTLEGNRISGSGGQGLHIYGANNIIENNLIGIAADGTSPMGNTGNGIYVSGVAGNHIGPGNTIAYNGYSGIEIAGSSASANTITQNSIYENTLAGISLSGGGNDGIAAPLITECTETSIGGTAPPFCTIEVFSDAGDEGGVYEGITTSDGTGAFVFNKPGGWTGQYITATATDASGNTSAFSPAASVATEPATWGRIKAGW